MSGKFVTLQEAADLSNKSVQTIRRSIKAKKLSVKKKKTPQGFNYLISMDSLISAYGLKIQTEIKESEKAEVKSEKKKDSAHKKEVEKSSGDNADSVTISGEDFRSFAQTMERLVSQHAEERQNFMRLITTLQEKIYMLENQLSLLKEPEKKSWFQFWK